MLHTAKMRLELYCSSFKLLRQHHTIHDYRLKHHLVYKFSMILHNPLAGGQPVRIVFIYPDEKFAGAIPRLELCGIAQNQKQKKKSIAPCSRLTSGI